MLLGGFMLNTILLKCCNVFFIMSIENFNLLTCKFQALGQPPCFFLIAIFVSRALI
jgi:hypothetical protein